MKNRIVIKFSLVVFSLALLISISAPTVLCAETDPDASAENTVLVTGANRGIGLELARQYRERGYRVIGTARNPDKATELKAMGAQVEMLDVTDPESVAALGERLKDTEVDILINNAGVRGGRLSSLQELDFEAIEHTMAVNTLGPMRVTQAVFGSLEKGRGKTIIQISSVMGSIENNWGGDYDYRVSKTALNMLNKTLALELAEDGFICVVLHPGWVKTDLGGAGASLTPEQSVTGLLKVIDNLDDDSNGKFYDYKGDAIPW